MLKSVEPITTAPVRILIADDQPAVRRGLIERLGAGLNLQVVAEAGSVEAALGQLTRLAPDVVITDARLPVTGGLDLSRQIMNCLPGTLCIIHTGTPIHADELRLAGAAAMVPKQLLGDQLLQTVAQLILARDQRSGTT